MTGASGFLGRAIVRGLTDEALPITRTSHGDVREAKASWFDGADVVIHAAGATAQRRPAEELWATNAAGALAVIRAAAAAGIDSVVLVSSASVYGVARAHPLAEDHAPSPEGLYGFSTLAAETGFAAFSHELNVSIARVFNVYGRGGYGVVDRWIAQTTIGKPIEVAGRTVIRDYVHVDSVADTVVRLVGRAGVWNVGTGHGRTLHQVAQLIAAAAPRRLAPRVLASEPAEDGAVDQSVADTTKLRNNGVLVEDRLAAYLAEAFAE